ncbi:hypothetical protein KEM48_001144 [Puccinia striiformis f. sp. tritici PST-130]|nr:hypothetical protein KEM48_001144 [Puccinia striiformis f. sp. tritici PST-130]
MDTIYSILIQIGPNFVIFNCQSCFGIIEGTLPDPNFNKHQANVTGVMLIFIQPGNPYKKLQVLASQLEERSLETLTFAWPTTPNYNLFTFARPEKVMYKTVLYITSVPTLQLILQLQAELDVTLGQIRYVFYALCPGPIVCPPDQIDDQHLKESKLFRLHGLYHFITNKALDRVSHAVQVSDRPIEHLKLFNSDCYRFFKTSVAGTRTDVLDFISACYNGIKLTISSGLEGSDFDHVE